MARLLTCISHLASRVGQKEQLRRSQPLPPKNLCGQMKAKRLGAAHLSALLGTRSRRHSNRDLVNWKWSIYRREHGEK